MGFAEDLSRLSEQIRQRLPHIKGEEATKHALVVPFLQVLGFDVFNPQEVQPEYSAEIGHRKGGPAEKVDYAISIDGKIALFVECKAADVDVSGHDGQLARYFNSTAEVKVAMLTNGVRVRIFSDLQRPNIMDEIPWLDVNLTELKPPEIDALKKLRRLDFAPDQVIALAEEMVFYNALITLLSAQLREPSESLVRWAAGEIPAVGRVTQKVLDRLKPILRKALQTSIVEHVTRSLASPPAVAHEEPKDAPAPADAVTPTEGTRPPSAEEVRAFDSISGWVKEVNNGIPLAFRDAQTYFTIHQANWRRWFIRMRVESAPFWIAFRHVKPEELRALAPGFDELAPSGMGDSRLQIKSVDDLLKLRSAVIMACEREAARGPADETAA